MGSPITLMMRPGHSLVAENGAHCCEERTKQLSSDRDLNRAASVGNGLAAHQTLCAVHGNGAHGVLPEMLSDLEHKARVTALDLKSVQDVGQL